MSGILAVINEHLEEHQVVAAVNTLAHRGPDGCGVHLDRKLGVTLAHRRLAIVDPTGGAQPLFSPDRRLILICDGMICEAQKHRAVLRREGYSFQTESAFEVLLALYQRYGSSFLERVDGEFALVLLDRGRGKVLIARDRFGVKPLYYCKTAQGYVFASEAKAIFATGLLKPSLDVAAIRDNFCGLFTDHIFTGIQSVPIASCLTLDVLDQRIDTHIYWELPDEPVRATPVDLQTAKTALVAQLGQAIDRRVTADGLTGIFLSGGVDSMIIAQLAHQRHHQIKLFHLCFHQQGDQEQQQGDQEQQQARRLARKLGTDYTEVEVDEHTLLAAVKEYLWFVELPSHNCHGVAMYLLSRQAAQEVSVTLTGEGADLLFLGHPYFRRSVQNSIKDLLAYAVALGVRPTPHPMTNLRCSMAYQRLTALLFDPYHRRSLLQHSPVPEVQRHANGREGQPRTWRLLKFSISGRLAQYFLPVLSDRCEMAHGLSGRQPYLDRQLVAFACGLPRGTKIRHGEEKYILRELGHELCSNPDIARVKKPFIAPVLAVKRGGSSMMEAMIADYLSTKVIQRAGVFSSRVITELLRLREHDLLPSPINKKIDGVLMFVMMVHILHEKFTSPL